MQLFWFPVFEDRVGCIIRCQKFSKERNDSTFARINNGARERWLTLGGPIPASSRVILARFQDLWRNFADRWSQQQFYKNFRVKIFEWLIFCPWVHLRLGLFRFSLNPVDEFRYSYTVWIVVGQNRWWVRLSMKVRCFSQCRFWIYHLC